VREVLRLKFVGGARGEAIPRGRDEAGPPAAGRADWASIHRELKRKHVTLSILRDDGRLQPEWQASKSIGAGKQKKAA
jgi:hypothetical protein